MCCYDCLTKNSNLSVARKVELEEQQHLIKAIKIKINNSYFIGK